MLRMVMNIIKGEKFQDPINFFLKVLLQVIINARSLFRHPSIITFRVYTAAQKTQFRSVTLHYLQRALNSNDNIDDRIETLSL